MKKINNAGSGKFIQTCALVSQAHAQMRQYSEVSHPVSESAIYYKVKNGMK